MAFSPSDSLYIPVLTTVTSMSNGAEPGTDPGDERPPRPLWLLALDPILGPVVLGKLLSNAGMWCHNIVSAIIAFQITGSALMVGLVSIAQFLPQTLLAPLSGAMADRTDRRSQLVLGRLMIATGSGALAVWIFLSGIDGLPGIAPVLVSAVFVGFGLTIGNPALHALLPALVQRNELASAITLNSVPFTVGRAAGPAVGAVIAATAGPAYAFSLAAAANVLFAAILLKLKIDRTPPPKPGANTSVRYGLRYVRAHRTILLPLAGVVAVSLGSDPVLTLTPALAHSLDQEPHTVGYMASAFGIGAGCTILFVRIIQRRIGIAGASTLGLLLMAAGNGLAPVAWSLSSAAAAFTITGSGMSIALPSLNTQIQSRLPDEFRGRVMALWLLCLQGTRPFAALITGGTADATSVHVSFAAMALLVAGAAWLCRPSQFRD